MERQVWGLELKIVIVWQIHTTNLLRNGVIYWELLLLPPLPIQFAGVDCKGSGLSACFQKKIVNAVKQQLSTKVQENQKTYQELLHLAVFCYLLSRRPSESMTSRS